ncbi:hypothetical protein AEA42_19695, partial [Shewanella sp. Sh95]
APARRRAPGPERPGLDRLRMALTGPRARPTAATTEVTTSARAVAEAAATLVGSSQELTVAVQESTEQLRGVSVGAREVADRVVFMAGGVVVEEGPADDVLLRPQHALTRSFVGAMDSAEV